LAPKLNATTIIPNQKIFKAITNKTSLSEAFSIINKFLAKTIIGFLETLYLPGFINIDFADFKTVFKQKGQIAYFSWGEGEGINRADKALEAIMKNPLLGYNNFKPDKILFNITGSKDLKVKEVEKVSKSIFDLNPSAKIIIGISQNNQYRNKIKITLLNIGHPAKEKKLNVKEKPAQKTRKKKSKKAEQNNHKKKKELKKEKTRQEKKKETKINQKEITRRDALDLHKKLIEEETKMLEEEQKWDIPTFLRKKYSR